MPRKPKVSPAQRRDWLDRHERGERQDAIAKADKVNPRTVGEHIERARLERSFEAAQQEQLGEALRRHQEDMLDLLTRTKAGIDVPPLSNTFGFERPSASPEREVRIPFESGEGQVVTVIIRHGLPTEVRLIEEDSRLWHALKEHLGNKNPLWRDITVWQRALLKELQANAALSQAVKKMVEARFRLPVLVQAAEQQPHLTPPIVRLTQIEVASRSQGEPPSDFPSRLEVRGGTLNDGRTSTYLTERVAEPEKIKEALTEVIQDLVDSAEARSLAEVHRDLADCTRKTRGQLEDYLLLHHIPGRCRLCKKLGGQ